MNGSVVEGGQGICPDGWHVPKDSEWFALEDGLKDEGQSCSRLIDGGMDTPTNVFCATAGTKLQVGGSSGFSAILAGFRNATESFEYRSLITLLWSSTEFNDFKGATSAWERCLNLDVSEVDRFTNDKAAALSVRCLKD